MIRSVAWHTCGTFAFRLVMAEVNLKTVQGCVRHGSITMTARYAHPAPAHTLKELELSVLSSTVSVQSGHEMAP